MSLSMYQISVPVFVRALENLSSLLAKGKAFAEAKKIEATVLENSRLAADMFPLKRQVQIASDAVKGCAARLAGVEIPNFPDTENTFDELEERIAKTLAFLKTIKEDKIDGTEDKTVKLKIGPNEMEFKGHAYLLGLVMPNLYFHITTVYAILRHNGVEIGKMDFLGQVR